MVEPSTITSAFLSGLGVGRGRLRAPTTSSAVYINILQANGFTPRRPDRGVDIDGRSNSITLEAIEAISHWPVGDALRRELGINDPQGRHFVKHFSCSSDIEAFETVRDLDVAHFDSAYREDIEDARRLAVALSLELATKGDMTCCRAWAVPSVISMSTSSFERPKWRTFRSLQRATAGRADRKDGEGHRRGG